MSEPMTTDTVLSATGVEKHFRQGPKRIDVLRGVDLTVRRGDSVAIVGAYGAG